jgi:hypothetical protein
MKGEIELNDRDYSYREKLSKLFEEISSALRSYDGSILNVNILSDSIFNLERQDTVKMKDGICVMERILTLYKGILTLEDKRRENLKSLKRKREATEEKEVIKRKYMNTKSSQNHFAAFFLSITDQQSPETTQ